MTYHLGPYLGERNLECVTIESLSRELGETKRVLILFYGCNYHLAVLAQLVERVAFNHVVVGSIPTDGVALVVLPFFFFFRVPPLAVIGSGHSFSSCFLTRFFVL
jgi:hypothetical protein